jgi:hypothetical protein
VFGPGTNVGAAAAKLIHELADRLGISLDGEAPADPTHA